VLWYYTQLISGLMDWMMKYKIRKIFLEGYFNHYCFQIKDNKRCVTVKIYDNEITKMVINNRYKSILPIFRLYRPQMISELKRLRKIYK